MHWGAHAEVHYMNRTNAGHVEGVRREDVVWWVGVWWEGEVRIKL